MEHNMSNIVPLEQRKENQIVIDDDLMKIQGMGSELVATKDVLIPRLVILQALSPQVNKKKAEFIDGAEVGDFCNVATSDIYKESVTVIPCFFITNYLEWRKNRGGLANNYGDDPTITKQATRNDKNQMILPSGNTLEETAQWYCLLSIGGNWERIFFPLKATNLKHSRKWMTLCRAENIKDSKGDIFKPPLFWRSWQLSIVADGNDQGDWYTFKPEKRDTVLDLFPDRSLLKACMSFYTDLKGGKVKGDIESTQDEYSGNRAAADPNEKDIPF
jgi:hypothetical protein